MDYYLLTELATDLGYELAMSGAETFRVEESIVRVLRTYGIESEVFAIPNCLHVSFETDKGKPVTRMRRIGYHGNDLEAVEKFNALSRRICAEKPEPHVAKAWLDETRASVRKFSLSMNLFGDFLGSFGFALFFGGSLTDGLWAGLCGIIVGLVGLFMDKVKANPFFSTISSSFLMSFAAYTIASFGLVNNVDTVIIGTLMILVPGLLFTNAMRDIIYGDTNSGVNRIVQVLLIAVALALGTGAAWNVIASIWGAPVSAESIVHSLGAQCLYSFLGCLGFAFLFNIHGPGALLCTLGGVLAWILYDVVYRISGSDLIAYFWAALGSSFYAEIMARIRKCPAIAYLVVAIFPLIPGAGVYYTMNYAVQGQMDAFASSGMHTAATAGIIAVGILLASTVFRMWTLWKVNKAHA